ncbi:MAG: tRNA pseudouridine(38-40) synthase TruA [Candidatus Omnitrophica bacterium]|nr:tRNA pseudouridine(38-40) synthase TruA [Candidatus Omnitrophota bacterium]
MRNILLFLEYEGTAYHGWQTQSPKAAGATIQGTVEAALSRLLRQPIRLNGSGRTDAGVHARRQAANFTARVAMPLPQLCRALNAVLPRDIRVIRARRMPSAFHAQFSCRRKRYRYFICNQRYAHVFTRAAAHFVPWFLDVRLMQAEAQVLRGRHDFKSFQTADKKERASVRTIFQISVRRRSGQVIIEIEADGFLYNMARAIAGTLIDIGRGKLPPGSMRRILAAKDRAKAGPNAPAKGLFLWDVVYS